MKKTVLDLINEIEAVNAKWNDKVCIVIEGENYLFAIDSESMYTEVLNDKIYFDVVDADSSDDPVIIDSVQDFKTFFEKLQFSKRIPAEKIKSLLVYFNAVELNDDDSIDVQGWETIEKNGNQILITVSSDLKQW